MQHTHIHTHIYLVDMRKMYAFKEMIDIGLFDEISSCNNCIGIVYTCMCYITKTMGPCLLEGTWDWLRWRNDPLSDMEKRLNVIHTCTYIHHTQLSTKQDGRGNLERDRSRLFYHLHNQFGGCQKLKLRILVWH